MVTRHSRTPLKAILRPCRRTAKALKQDLAAARADLASEQARTTRAIAAFEVLARRLEAMAAQHAIKPWWQQLLRRA
jgi:hypothetical protein